MPITTTSAGSPPNTTLTIINYGTTGNPRTTANLPSTIVAGRFLIVILVANVGGTIPAAPSGWTRVTFTIPGGFPLIWFYWKIADGNEGATITYSDIGTDCCAISLQAIGVTTPTAGSVGTGGPSSNPSIAIPSTNLISSDVIYLCVYSGQNTGGIVFNSVTVPTTQTPTALVDNGGQSNLGEGMIIGYEHIVASGATGTRTATTSTANSTTWTGAAIALK